jgi:hypothetical protein
MHQKWFTEHTEFNVIILGLGRQIKLSFYFPGDTELTEINWVSLLWQSF